MNNLFEKILLLFCFYFFFYCTEKKVYKDFGCGKKHTFKKKAGKNTEETIIDETPNEDENNQSLTNEVEQSFNKKLGKEKKQKKLEHKTDKKVPNKIGEDQNKNKIT